MHRALIVDDERLARREMAYLLRAHDTIEIVGDAANVTDAARALRRLKPDVIFLDIQLGNETGFDLLERVATPCEVIFTTAYDAYAIRAFELNALDYLLKPIEPERLREAVRRLDQRAGRNLSGRGRLEPDDPILARSAGLLRSFRVAEIAAIAAAGDYTNVTTVRGDEFLIKCTMKQWQERLPGKSFVRLHRSTIVNMNHVERLGEDRQGRFSARVRGIAEPLAVSRRQVKELKRRLR